VRDTYPAAVTLAELGEHRVRAEVVVTENGQERTLEVSTNVDATPSPAERMAYARDVVGQNPLARGSGSDSLVAEATASSDAGDAALAVDGRQGTAWVAAKSDREPWLRLSFAQPVRGDRVVLSPVDASPDTRGDHDTPTEIVLVVDGEALPPVAVDPRKDPVGAIVLPLGGTVALRRLEVRVTGRTRGGKKAGQVGFAEVAVRGG
jgi:hypothetical protein